jgi:hypothetical protein
MASILAFRSDIFPSLWPFVGRAGLGARFFCRHLFFFEETLPAIICQENSHLHKKLADAALGLPTLHLGQKSFLTVDMAKLQC